MAQELVFEDNQIEAEAVRLHNSLKKVHWTYDDCLLIAPLTLEINQLKKEKNAVILAHSYQTPDIVFGVADFTGDSLGLSKEAAKTDADTIIFAGVVFMAETAKILSPEKTVIVPSRAAGCSLADSITGEDVRKIKEEHPGTKVIAYVNTTADVKAETDICVTSANVEKVVTSLPDEKIIFIPDRNMANYLRKLVPNKEIISWADGACIVHEEYRPESITSVKTQFVDLMVIAHSECPSEVLDEVDMVGGTSDMQNYIEDHPDQKKFFLVTECGLSDRFAIEYPDREFYGACSLCPYMKEVMLKNILESLKNPSDDQIITLDADIMSMAKGSLDEMLKY